jgi:hypothetical protein
MIWEVVGCESTATSSVFLTITINAIKVCVLSNTAILKLEAQVSVSGVEPPEIWVFTDTIAGPSRRVIINAEHILGTVHAYSSISIWTVHIDVVSGFSESCEGSHR